MVEQEGVRETEAEAGDAERLRRGCGRPGTEEPEDGVAVGLRRGEPRRDRHAAVGVPRGQQVDAIRVEFRQRDVEGLLADDHLAQGVPARHVQEPEDLPGGRRGSARRRPHAGADHPAKGAGRRHLVGRAPAGQGLFPAPLQRRLRQQGERGRRPQAGLGGGLVGHGPDPGGPAGPGRHGPPPVGERGHLPAARAEQPLPPPDLPQRRPLDVVHLTADRREGGRHGIGAARAGRQAFQGLHIGQAPSGAGALRLRQLREGRRIRRGEGVALDGKKFELRHDRGGPLKARGGR
ncbi:hypothetical protein ACFQFG_26600 [Methylobacterium persicinum]